MQRNRSRERGQSMIEYLIVAAAVIAAIVIFGPNIQGKVAAIGTSSVNSLDGAATAVTNRIVVGDE